MIQKKIGLYALKAIYLLLVVLEVNQSVRKVRDVLRGISK